MQKRITLLFSLLLILAQSTVTHYGLQPVDPISPDKINITDFVYEKIGPVIAIIKLILKNIPESVYHMIFPRHEHCSETAHVRFTENDELCEQEKAYVKKRTHNIAKALEKVTGVSVCDDHTPKIALCFSGGGFRSMLTTLGFLRGASEIGLLDSTLYCTSLSGSTWALGPWLASGKTLHEFHDTVSQKIYHGVDHINDPYEISEMLEIILVKLASKQFLSAIDVYGGVLANTLLKGLQQNPMLVKLTETHKTVDDGHVPLPIYTAIMTHSNPYEWLEISPYEIGGSFLKAYIPTWAYGRRFSSGSSTDFPPEQTLGYFMGMFGSAFEINLKDIINHTAANLTALGHKLPGIVAAVLSRCLNLVLESFLGEIRLFPSVLFNFTYNCDFSPISHRRTMSLIDAGIDFNLPLPPLLKKDRAVDIIIVYDSSASIYGSPQLKKAAEYAQRKGLKFPDIDFEHVDKKLVSVFKNENDPETPIIIYFPRIKNNEYSQDFDPDSCVESGYCHTFNFEYSQEEALMLSGFAEFTIKQHQGIIKDVILDIMQERYGYTIKRNRPVEPPIFA